MFTSGGEMLSWRKGGVRKNERCSGERKTTLRMGPKLLANVCPISSQKIRRRTHTFDAWGNRPVDSITTEEIRALIKSRVGDKAPSHQKNVLKFIRGVFKYALELGVINRNPTPDMKFRTGDKIKRVL